MPVFMKVTDNDLYDENDPDLKIIKDIVKEEEEKVIKSNKVNYLV